MKCCKTCCWYDDCDGDCLNPDSEHFTEPAAADDCGAWEGVANAR